MSNGVEAVVVPVVSLSLLVHQLRQPSLGNWTRVGWRFLVVVVY